MITYTYDTYTYNIIYTYIHIKFILYKNNQEVNWLPFIYYAYNNWLVEVTMMLIIIWYNRRSNHIEY